MAAAQRKLEAALPAGWQADARRLSSRFHLDPAGWFQGAAAADHLRAVAEAVWGERRLRIRYESWNGVVDRELEPLGLVLKAGVWYLAAGAGGEPRTYRLSNVLELAVSDERFARPPGFDLAAYRAASTQRFEADVYRDTAVVRASPRGLALLKGLSPAVAQAVARATTSSIDSADSADRVAGWTRLAIPIESVDHAARELLGLGAEVEALAPAALRERLTEAALRLVALYADHPASA